MTLDELVTALEQLRAACPAAGMAVVEPAAVDGVEYHRGTVWLLVGLDRVVAYAVVGTATPASARRDDEGERSSER